MATPLCLKVTCLALVLAKQVLVVSRFSMLYLQYYKWGGTQTHFLLYNFYVPCIITGTIFEIFVILYLRREIKKDSVWWNDRFCRVFTLYSLMFWIYLYWQILFQVYIFCFEEEYYPGSRAVDLLEQIANAGISVLVIVILYWPRVSTTTHGRRNASVGAGFFTRDENVQIQNISDGFVHTNQSNRQQRTSSRKGFLYTAVVFLVLYLAEIVLLILAMFQFDL